MTKVDPQKIKQLKQIATRLRMHSLKATSKAGSGHPSTCLSAADMMSALFFHAMRFEPEKPTSPLADRLVLSKGHAAPLLWAAWAEAGVIPEEELLHLREIDSPLEGHPTPRFPWVDVASGSLGQGLSVGVGMALNNRFLDESEARVFVLMGDGECAEGSVWEAAALAGHYKLNHLIGLVDVNKWGQSEETMYGHDVKRYAAKFEANGWKAIILDGHNMEETVQALDQAMAEKEKPTVLVAKTEKGKGVPQLEGKAGWHGKALSKEELEKALKELGDVPPVSKNIPAPPTKIKTFGKAKTPEPPTYQPGEKVATRAAYGSGLVKLGNANPLVVALDGDTKNSTYSEKFLKAHPKRFFECFIAEQNMVGVALGLATRGKIPFVSTFGAFFTRAYDQIRMAAISKKGIKLCGSHAGVSIGEDGPSQMALEDLAMMRAVPGMAVLLPGDAVASERLVVEAAKYKGPVYIRTQRPATPVLYSSDTEFPIGGSKILKKSDNDRVTVVAAGVTLMEALQAYTVLEKEGIIIRVIDLYSLKPVDERTLLEAFNETGKIITVEDHYPEGGLGDAVLGTLAPYGCVVHKLAVNRIPRSGKPAELMALYGISADHIVQKVCSLCE